MFYSTVPTFSPKSVWLPSNNYSKCKVCDWFKLRLDDPPLFIHDSKGRKNIHVISDDLASWLAVFVTQWTSDGNQLFSSFELVLTRISNVWAACIWNLSFFNRNHKIKTIIIWLGPLSIIWNEYNSPSCW